MVGIMLRHILNFIDNWGKNECKDVLTCRYAGQHHIQVHAYINYQ